MKTDKGTLDRMTPHERLKEVASLLARGFLRAHASHADALLPPGDAQDIGAQGVADLVRFLLGRSYACLLYTSPSPRD